MYKDDGISHTGRRQRLRERVLRGGSEGMTDRELLEFLLGYALPRQDVNPLGHRLADAFGSLDGVLHASKDSLLKIHGVGENTADFLAAYGEVIDAVIRGSASGKNLTKEAFFSRAEELMKEFKGPALAVMSASRSGSGCFVHDWPRANPEGGARWLITAASRLNTNKLAMIWKRSDRSAALSASDRRELAHLKTLLSPAGIYIQKMYLLNEAGERYEEPVDNF